MKLLEYYILHFKDGSYQKTTRNCKMNEKEAQQYFQMLILNIIIDI